MVTQPFQWNSNIPQLSWLSIVFPDRPTCLADGRVRSDSPPIARKEEKPVEKEKEEEEPPNIGGDGCEIGSDQEKPLHNASAIVHEDKY